MTDKQDDIRAGEHPPASFAGLCRTLSDVMNTRSSTRKISLFADYLKGLTEDRDIALAVQFTVEGAFSTLSGKRAAVGHRTVALTAAEFCGVDYDKVFRPCRAATGSTSEAIEKLMQNIPEAVARRNPAWLGLGEVADGFERLAASSGRGQKQQILTEMWEKMTAGEIRFLIRMLGKGSLRIGFEVRSILPAIALAYGTDAEQVRRVHMLTGEIGKTALLARSGELESARFRMFQPVAFMLASPMEAGVGGEAGTEAGTEVGAGAGTEAGAGGRPGTGSVAGSVADPQTYVAEEKFDGMRAQAHIGPGSDPYSVRLFSRDLNDVTAAFPDAAGKLMEAMGDTLSSLSDPSEKRGTWQHAGGKDAAADVSGTRIHPEKNDPDGRKHRTADRSPVESSSRQPVPREAVFDGELCVLDDGRIQPFQRLQKRMGVKKPGDKLLAEHPVRFIAYDLLFVDGEPVLDLPLQIRRKRLEDLCARTGIPCSRQHVIESAGDIERLFRQALEHGNEGLMLKRRDSVYEYGQRSKSWLKVKQPAGSLDTVIMYAHAGSGRRGGTYSDFTLGIRVDEDERFEEQFIPIGKACGGYTDQDLKKINQRIRELAVERFGPTLSLRPGIVVEVEFDDIQVNRRTKAGYTLRLPRFRAIRWDMAPSDTDTLADVERLYRERSEQSGQVASHDNPVLHLKK